MRRILVPLDGTARAAAILPDARRLAGPDGALILVNEVVLLPSWETAPLSDWREAVDASREYLTVVADRLRAENVKVETQTMLGDNVARSIDEAAMVFDADLVAVTTHASAGPGRLPRDSIAWEALAHSPVPVLIRHIADADVVPPSPEPSERQIMVPLDGSALAESALPLARELAVEWKAAIWLVHVVSHYPITGFARTEIDPEALTDDMAWLSARRYLNQIASQFGGIVHPRVLLGSPIDELVVAAASWAISDVVLSSHGRTGPAHVLVGSVADGLLHHLDLPVMVVPAFAAESMNQSKEDAKQTAARDHAPRLGKRPRRVHPTPSRFAQKIEGL